ncbi:MAG: CDP-diacylglycerol--glycerol-3-phosphate 3-phosphatidyltransferase [Gemmatimonadetes bacterium]|nr:CDP-diacylglycerol--glycerol-3-phosphate 3-phosphatidyltransferase [Gemmatimonadota bacterium]MDA1104088.1 CDP-diacylglycerol--glycerol-3-phosphate 3-phosphatidyltransferase [Gemmatimonadota bacterium]
MTGSRLNLPNVITVTRISACPLIFWLAISPDLGARFWAFALFVVAALSDVWDGYLARRYDLITDMGKLLDPVADKLLLAATLIPFYVISHRGGALDPVPFLGPLPGWILGVIFGREIFITGFRSYAVRKGVVIAAGWAGKRKTLFQMLFIGALLLWYPLLEVAEQRAWSNGPWTFFSQGLAGFVLITLATAVVLTVYSMLDYLWSYRTLVGIRD